MRVIEKQMIDAIKSGREFNSGNTSVHHAPVIGGCEVEVRLHGHLIAKRFYQGDRPALWKMNLCGWNTPTTRSRLTALCQEFVPGCHGVVTRLGQASVRDVEEWRNMNVADSGWFTPTTRV